MTGEMLALGLTLGVHIVGAVALIGAIVHGSDSNLRGWWPSDEDSGGGSDRAVDRPTDPTRPPGGLPLPDASQSPVRLREPGRLREAHPRPVRRPAHAPDPARVPERA